MTNHPADENDADKPRDRIEEGDYRDMFTQEQLDRMEIDGLEQGRALRRKMIEESAERQGDQGGHRDDPSQLSAAWRILFNESTPMKDRVDRLYELVDAGDLEAESALRSAWMMDESAFEGHMEPSDE